MAESSPPITMHGRFTARDWLLFAILVIGVSVGVPLGLNAYFNALERRGFIECEHHPPHRCQWLEFKAEPKPSWLPQAR